MANTPQAEKRSRRNARRAAVNKALFKDWGGVYDPHTKTHMSKFTSFHLSTVDSAAKKYAYVAYYNLSGICGFIDGTEEECIADGDEPVPSFLVEKPLTLQMLTLQSRMNAAILSQV